MQFKKSDSAEDDGAAMMNALLDTVITYAMKRPDQLNAAAVNLNDVLTNIADDIIYKNNNDHCHITIVDELPVIKGIPTSLINQLFQNLIDNAIKFNSSDMAEVSISYTETFKEYIFSVSDNGIGISPINYHSLFSTWGQGADKGKRVGLVICKTIVEHYGGKIWVESTLGKGSTFYFSLDKSSLKNNGELNSGYTSIDELQRGQMLILSA